MRLLSTLVAGRFIKICDSHTGPPRVHPSMSHANLAADSKLRIGIASSKSNTFGSSCNCKLLVI